MSKKHVVISGIHYPLSMMSYFIRAFERRADCDVTLVGPYTGQFIPWGGGMTITSKHVKVPQVALPQQLISRGSVPYAFVERTIQKHVDLWLQVDAGWHFSDRPEADVVALVKTDPHCLPYIGVEKISDYVFCMQTPYMKPQEYFLPYAYDPTVHYPVDAEKVYDACLIGLLYQTRESLIKQLRRMGRRVHYSIGEVFDEYREEYSKAKVALSWSSMDDLPARVWEAFAMGIPLVTNMPSDIHRFFKPGKHFLGFTDIDEAVSHVDFLLGNPVEAKAMRDAALEQVKYHTWDARVDELLKVCKIA